MPNTLISSIRGTIASKDNSTIDIDISNGITLSVISPLTTIEKTGNIGDPIKLLTSLQLRQDSVTLYGFASDEDRSAFETLINISGVGPKLAITILSILDARSLASAVETENTITIMQVPGVGKRTASRILLELKGKIDKIWNIPISIDESDDVFESLTSLGYSIIEAREAISKIPDYETLTVEDKLRISLQYLTTK